MVEIFGHKAAAIFDLWSIIHLLSGFVISSFYIDRSKRDKEINEKKIQFKAFRFLSSISKDSLVILLLAYLWELAELKAEQGLFGRAIMNWFDGVEYLGNRLFFDPILVLLGFKLGRWVFSYMDSRIQVNSSVDGIAYTRIPSLLYNSAKWGSRFILAAWLYVNVFLMPHSMMFQEKMFH